MSSSEQPKARLIGKHLAQIPMPAAVLDRAVVKRNCDQMLDACRDLGVKFRPHIKTHKVRYFTFHRLGYGTMLMGLPLMYLLPTSFIICRRMCLLQLFMLINCFKDYRDHAIAGGC